MSKQDRVHLVYTLQIKVNGTKQYNEPQIDDLVESIDDTLKSWFPKGEVQLEKNNVADGTKRVIITNVLPTVQRRASKPTNLKFVSVQIDGKRFDRASLDTSTEANGVPLAYTYGTVDGIVGSVVGDLDAAAKDGIEIGKEVDE